MPVSSQDYLNDTAQFDVARKRAQEQSGVNLQARKDAMARRFASLGNLDSGARIKQEELAANEEGKILQAANEGIDAQQQAELGRRKEVIQGQEFQAGEGQKGRDFAAQQAAIQRAYGTGERLGSQDFAGQQASLQRAYGTSERESGQTFASGERAGSQDFQAGEMQKNRDVQEAQFEKTFGLSTKQFGESLKQFNKTFGEEVRVNDANIGLANKMLDKKGVLDKLADQLSLNNIKGVFSGLGGGGSVDANSLAALLGYSSGGGGLFGGGSGGGSFGGLFG